jgi:rubrerythrin
MIELFRKVREILRNGKSKSTEPADILMESYRDLCRLAAQISRHADRAPYPHVARLLRRIAQEKRSSADLLRDKLVGTGTSLEDIPFEIKSGKNHWERMTQDLNDHRALEARLLERAALINERTPETAELLRRIAASERPHIEAFLDLIARADPQAEQT